MLAVGHDLQRHGVDRPELLDPLDDVGQPADEVFAQIGGSLRGGGEDPEREDVDEPQVVDTAHIDPVLTPRGDLTRRLEQFVRHAERSGKVVGRAGRNDSDGDIEPLALHGVDGKVDRSVASGHNHQVDRLVTVERIGIEVNRLRNHVIAVGLENFVDPRGIARDPAAPRLGIE